MMGYSYATAVLSALSDENERKKHSDKTVMAAIRTIAEWDYVKVRKIELINAVRYLLERQNGNSG